MLNGSGNTSSAEENSHKNGDTQSELATGWIAKRDRHMQLINPSVYGKETQNRSQAMAETRRQKALQRDQKEKQKIQKHFFTRDAQPGPTSTTPVVHELDIDGLRFQVLNGGSKLARTYSEILLLLQKLILYSRRIGAYDSGTSSPKQASIGGVTFFRSKNGNLYRSGIVKARK